MDPMNTYRSYEDLPKIKLPMEQPIFISDSTIRDGSQMPGIIMNTQLKYKIYQYLNKIGIEKLETFVYHDRDKKAIRMMLDHGYEFPEVTGWARAVPADIDQVLAIDGIEETGILMSVSDSHIIDKMGLSSRKAAEDKYLDALQYAVDHGLKTRAHIEDMTRADNTNFVYPLIEKIMDIDSNCIIRLCDTVGYGVPFSNVDEPFGIPSIVKQLKSNLGVKNIEVHTHDDFGLAVANTLAGYWYGANWSSLTFLGIGERAGNAELEKILLFLTQRVEGFEKYNLESIVEFSKFMEKEIGIKVPRNKSVVGKNIFAHESGIHSSGVLKNPFTYEPYPPEVVGGERVFLIGDSSGLELLRHKVQDTLNDFMDIEIELKKTDPRLKMIQQEIQELYDTEKRISCISDEEIRAYVEKYFVFKPIARQETHHESIYGEFNEERD